jgi:alkaline phosphatase D
MRELKWRNQKRGSQYNNPKFTVKSQDMKRVILSTLLICMILATVQAQKQSNVDFQTVPVVGAVSHRSVALFLELNKCTEAELVLLCTPDSGSEVRVSILPSWIPSGLTAEGCRLRQVVVEGLEPGLRYRGRVYQGKRALGDSAFYFTTRALWEWRTPAPDFTFIAGSCLYINETRYDRPGPPYGKDSKILRHMQAVPADFNLWLGDNVYLREVDYSSPSGMLQRYLHTRSHPDVQALLSARPNYAIWDDHDFGPNNADRSFSFKSTSLALFSAFWPAFRYGSVEAKGAFSHFSYSDADFFLMDNRYHRAPNAWDKADTSKAYWGTEQLTWLKDKLLNSRATFKFIVNGNQIVNTMTDTECLHAYPAERNALYDFIRLHKIGGVLILSGDRHFTEVLKDENATTYPLYDITCSPLTSGAYEKITETSEAQNSMRVEGTLLATQNFLKIHILGERKHRIAKVEAIDQENKVRWSLQIAEDELKPVQMK